MFSDMVILSTILSIPHEVVSLTDLPKGVINLTILMYITHSPCWLKNNPVLHNYLNAFFWLIENGGERRPRRKFDQHPIASG